MSPLGFGTFLALATVCTCQLFQGGNYYGGFQSPSPFGRQPVGFNTAPNNVPFVGAQAMVGYDPYFSELQRTFVYAQNLGFDQSSAEGPNCVNGRRIRNYAGAFSCQCFAGFSGASCNTPTAADALNSARGSVCVMTQGTFVEDDRRIRQSVGEGALGPLKMEMERLMSGVPPTDGPPLLSGPGVLADCSDVPAESPMAPVYLKSALSDYGFIKCKGQRMCVNMACPACTMFNPISRVCDHVTNPLERGLPGCQVRGGEAPEALKVDWYRQALSRPKLSGEGGVPAGQAPIGNNPFSPFGNSPFSPFGNNPSVGMSPFAG